ncbi:penicillin-binding protein activator LpoB [Marinobacter sp. BGYM27]|uniref:penicillin-binding protein activator LpoB n=1 Tax=unclassified Marinobacter TaxID=83889 RepID=UPI0021A403E1|nr:penicillin-binding protein activator LpoB [Marinobacter sp. BGYM27]MDG5500155.1 penicillin-binding protein activator LpoB [Marinobacter sp. BGYM27]
MTLTYKGGICTALALSSLLLTGCATQIENAAGKPTVYEDPSTTGRVSGVGIESQDVVGMTDQMMRDMLSNPMLTGRDTSPRIIIDNQYMRNESSSVINTNQLTDRLRIELNRAANGRMVFVARELSDMVQQERDLKRDGVVDGGTIRKTRAQAGADFRLAGRITSLDAVDRSTGTKSRYSQITFEMVDLELGTIVWSGLYEMRKAAQDNVLYR